MRIKKFLTGTVAMLIAFSMAIGASAANYKPLTTTVVKNSADYASATIEIIEANFPELFASENWSDEIIIEYNVTIDGEEESTLLDVGVYAHVINDEDVLGEFIDDWQSEVNTGETLTTTFIADFEVTTVESIEFDLSFGEVAGLNGKEVVLEIESITIGGNEIGKAFDSIKVPIQIENLSYGTAAQFAFDESDYAELYNPENWANGMEMEFVLMADGEKIVLDDEAGVIAFFGNDVVDWSKALKLIDELELNVDSIFEDDTVFDLAEFEAIFDEDAFNKALDEMSSSLDENEDFDAVMAMMFEIMGMSMTAVQTNDDGTNSVTLKTSEELDSVLAVSVNVMGEGLNDYVGKEITLEIIDISINEDDDVDEPTEEDPADEEPIKEVEKVKNPTTGAGGIVAVVGMSALALTAVTVSRKRK